jgi:hypothetical protein
MRWKPSENTPSDLLRALQSTGNESLKIVVVPSSKTFVVFLKPWRRHCQLRINCYRRDWLAHLTFSQPGSICGPLCHNNKDNTELLQQQIVLLNLKPVLHLALHLAAVKSLCNRRCYRLPIVCGLLKSSINCFSMCWNADCYQNHWRVMDHTCSTRFQ